MIFLNSAKQGKQLASKGRKTLALLAFLLKKININSVFDSTDIEEPNNKRRSGSDPSQYS